jgi:hypothetical protein
VYGTSACLPTSATTEQPEAGAIPPVVFKRWIYVVRFRRLPPRGPVFDPITWSKKAGDRAFIWAGRIAGVDVCQQLAPHDTAIQRTLPRRATHGHRVGRVGFGLSSWLKK